MTEKGQKGAGKSTPFCSTDLQESGKSPKPELSPPFSGITRTEPGTRATNEPRRRLRLQGPRR